MALRLGALTTYAAAKAALKLGDDSQQATVERLIDVASSAIAKYCNRTFASTTKTEKGPLQDGPLQLVLRQRPVTTITSWKLDGVVQALDDLTIEDGEAGLVRVAFAIWPTYEAYDSLTMSPYSTTRKQRVEVSYTGGWVLPNDVAFTNPATPPAHLLPPDVEQGCVETVATLYLNQGANRRVRNESLGDYSVGYDGLNTAIGRGEAGLIPDEVAVTLNKYMLIEQE